MAESYLENLFGLAGRTAVVVGGTGVLGGALAEGLQGAKGSAACTPDAGGGASMTSSPGHLEVISTSSWIADCIFLGEKVSAGSHANHGVEAPARGQWDFAATSGPCVQVGILIQPGCCVGLRPAQGIHIPSPTP